MTSDGVEARSRETMSLGVSKTFLSFSETSVSASLGTPKPPHRTPLRASYQNDAAPWGTPPVTPHGLLRVSLHYLTGTLNWGPCSKSAHLQSSLQSSQGSPKAWMRSCHFPLYLSGDPWTLHSHQWAFRAAHLAVATSAAPAKSLPVSFPLKAPGWRRT